MRRDLELRLPSLFLQAPTLVTIASFPVLSTAAQAASRVAVIRKGWSF